jgi:hypothetical protein
MSEGDRGMRRTCGDGLLSLPISATSPFPLRNRPAAPVFGITGHRDPRPGDLPALEQRVCELFTQFQQRYPNTPLTLLSPLAEGADRLAARVALRCGLCLVAPLPLLPGARSRASGSRASAAPSGQWRVPVSADGCAGASDLRLGSALRPHRQCQVAGGSTPTGRGAACPSRTMGPGAAISRDA